MLDLAALLRDERPADGAHPVAFYAVRWDDPLGYLFAQPTWAMVQGGAAQLSSLGTRVQTVFREAKITEPIRDELGNALYLADGQSAPTHVLKQVEQEAAYLTGTFTLSTALETVPARALSEGLYPAPTRVIGVPGVNPYQGRINRYYGLASPSTIPTAEQIAAKKHFGQVLARVDGRLETARTTRDTFPVYDLLPFAERCNHCRTRPAETVKAGLPICALCDRRLSSQGGGRADSFDGLIIFHIPQSESILHAARTPGACRRAWQTLHKAVTRATNEANALTLFANSSGGVLAVNAGDVLNAMRKLASRFAALVRDHFKPAPRIVIAAALGDASPTTLYRIARKALGEALTQPDQDHAALHLLGGSASQTAFYTLDSLELLDDARKRLESIKFPPDLWVDFSAQIARNTAALYYNYGRLRLDSATGRALDSLEADWGKDTERYYRALDHTIALLRLARKT